MARSRESKKNILEILEEKIARSTSLFLANLKGLTVKQAETLRRSCRKDGVDCLMAKKTLLKIAFKNRGIDIDPKKLDGEVALTFGYADEVAPARILASFGKTNETFGILGGVILSGSAGPQVLDIKSVHQLATLPSRDELLGSLVGSLASPMRGFVSVLGGNTRQFVYVLKAIADARSA